MKDLRFAKLHSSQTLIWKLYKVLLYTYSYLFFLFFRIGNLKSQAIFSMYHGTAVDEHILGAALQTSTTSPNVRIVLVSNDASLLRDTGFEIAKIHSPKYLKALAQSKLIVNNLELPPYFRKRKGQLYIQFWHGTPIKKLGRDRTGKLHDARYSERLLRDAKFWDLAISPSEYHSRILGSFSGYYGEVILDSYLFSSFEDTVRSFLLEKQFTRDLNSDFKIDRFKVLFAPSWRENADEIFKEFNTSQIASALSNLPDPIQIYWRQHQNYMNKVKLPANIIDTTKHPMVYQILPQMDLVVTDYSSIYFDCIRLDIPVLLFGPDLSIYLDSPGVYEFSLNANQFSYQQNLADLERMILSTMLSSAHNSVEEVDQDQMVRSRKHFGFAERGFDWGNILRDLKI